IPRKRHCNRASVLQRNAHRVVGKPHTGHAFVSRECQNTHSKPPTAPADGLPRVIVSCVAPAPQNRDCAPAPLQLILTVALTGFSVPGEKDGDYYADFE